VGGTGHVKGAGRLVFLRILEIARRVFRTPYQLKVCSDMDVDVSKTLIFCMFYNSIKTSKSQMEGQ